MFTFPPPIRQRVGIFGTDGTEGPIMDLNTLKNADHFGLLDTKRTGFDFPLKFHDYQKNTNEDIYQNTDWLEKYLKNINIINTNKLNVCIRYGLLNSLLCTVDGTFRDSKPMEVKVKWNDYTVSLFNKSHTYNSNFGLAAMQAAVTRKNPVKKDEIILIGKNESFAVYELAYDCGNLYVSKNPDGRLEDTFSLNMPLVELKCLKKGKSINPKPARRLSCFTDISTIKIEYQKKNKNVYTDFKYEPIETDDPKSDLHDHYRIQCLLKALNERRNDEITLITFTAEKFIMESETGAKCPYSTHTETIRDRSG